MLFIGTQISILYTSMYSPAEAATLKESHEIEEFVLGFLYLTLYIYSGWAETGALGWRIVRGHCQHKHFLEQIN